MKMHIRNFSISYAMKKYVKRYLIEANSYLHEALPNVTYPGHGHYYRRLECRFSTRSTDIKTTKSNAIGETYDKVTIDELKSSLKSRLSYVFDESVANRLVNNIQCNRANPKAPILEIAPGIGLVSREFLHQGVEKVIALETKKAFHPYLQSVQDDHGDCRFEFHEWDMLNIHEKFYAPHPIGSGYSYKTKETEIVNKLSRSAFTESETPYSVFTTGGSEENRKFIFYVLRNLPYEDPVLCKERVEFFFLVHPKFKVSIEAVLPTHNPSNYNKFFNYFLTFISLMYDITFLTKFKANDFVPSFPKKYASRKIDVTKRLLVKMQLKSNITEILPLDHHHAFSLFLRNIFRKRTMRIIPAMEMLVAGSGLHMMADGFTMMETIADVSPDRLLLLYKSMIHWPEYSVSHLKSYIEMKTQGGPMEDDHI